MTNKELKNKIKNLNVFSSTPNLLKQVLYGISEGTIDKKELKDKINKIKVFSSTPGLVKSILYKLADNAPEKEDKPQFEYVDLGLPSGTLWAKCNVGAETETDPGLYYMWGETEGHAKDSGYDFSNANYTSKGLNAISTNLSLAQDAANVRLGGDWRMPTNTEFEELYNNTNVTWTTINGVAGRKFANKTDASKYIFMPAAGLYDGSSLNSWGSGGYYWSSALYISSIAYGFYCDSSSQYTYYGYRYYGCSVRGVKSK